jgi:hypothetical protein
MSATTAVIVIVVSGAVVATASAVRSTWSPCGLSMLSTITPFTERARGHSFRGTAAWFMAGASVGGATLGLLMGMGAAVVAHVHLSVDARLWAAGAAGLVAAGSDGAILGWRIPVHRRQVNERWLDGYRPWVYGAGFGWQIGAGLVTYITTAGVYLLVVLGALTAAPIAALLLGIWFGLLRGMAVLLTRRVRSVSDLIVFHRRFEAALPLADRAVRGAELVVVLVAAAALATPVSLLLLAGLSVGVAGVSLVRFRRRRLQLELPLQLDARGLPATGPSLVPPSPGRMPDAVRS